MRPEFAVKNILYFISGFSIVFIITILVGDKSKFSDLKNKNLATLQLLDSDKSKDISSIYKRNYGIIIKNTCPFNNLLAETKMSVYEAPDNENIPGKTFKNVRTHLKPIIENPRYKLDPYKFLLVITRGGPNNQIFELREAVFIAIKLNRTIVIPKFFKHFTDSGRGAVEYVHPSHRIQVDYFCKFVSCVTIDQFRETCNHKPDRVVRLRNYDEMDFNIFERYLDMKIPRNGVTMDDEIAVPKVKQKVTMIFLDEIKNIFKTDARCLVFPYALFNLRTKMTFNGKNRANGERFSQILPFIESDSPEVKLMRAISRKTRNPFYITRLAQNYISARFKERQFITVHWRYEEEDTMKRCRWELENRKNKMPGGRIKFCEKTLKFGVGDLADVIAEKIKKIQNVTNIRDIYFASPPSEKKRIAEASKILEEKYGYNTLSSEDLEKYLQTRYSNCETLHRHFNDILSTAEMEVCSRGTVFLSSASSTWSLNVKHLRLLSNLKTIFINLDEDLYKFGQS